LSRHRKVNSNRSKLAVLVATGAFTVASAGTAWAVTSPASGTSAGTAQLTSVTQSAGTTTTTVTKQSPQQRTQELAALYAQRVAAERRAAALAAAKKAAAKKAAAKKAAEKKAAAKKAAAAKAAAAKKAAAKKKAESGDYSGTPQQIAQEMLSSFGWSSSQFSCLEPLWEEESGWSVTAYNAGSGAFGIPQALPGSKMASAGADWQTSAATQIKWGLGYIKDVYGSPCGAWDHEEADGWY